MQLSLLPKTPGLELEQRKPFTLEEQREMSVLNGQKLHFSGFVHMCPHAAGWATKPRTAIFHSHHGVMLDLKDDSSFTTPCTMTDEMSVWPTCLSLHKEGEWCRMQPASPTLTPFPQPTEVWPASHPEVSWVFWLINDFSHRVQWHSEGMISMSECHGNRQAGISGHYLPGTQHSSCCVQGCFRFPGPAGLQSSITTQLPGQQRMQSLGRGGVGRSVPLMLIFCRMKRWIICSRK